VTTGDTLPLWDSADWTAALGLALLWLACLGVSLAGRDKLRTAALGAAANLLIVVALLLAGAAATRLLEGQPPAARISLGAGFWLTLAGAYVILFAARSGLREHPNWRRLCTWASPAALVALLATGYLDDLSIMREVSGNEDRLLQEIRQHIALFGGSVLIGSVLGVLLGIWATRSRRAERPIFFVTNITQTIPSLALFGLLIAPLSALSFAYPFLRDIGIRGIGVTPAMIALVIYSLLPIVRNTYVGLRQVDPAAIDAGLGMGMTRRRVFRRIEAPLAAPLVLEGVRTASVQSVGLTTVAALIGAGGLGWFVFRGMEQLTPDFILLGAIPIIILAVLVDAVMRAVVRWSTPRGITGDAA
jgi:osmoprotectant transport system permease protein